MGCKITKYQLMKRLQLAFYTGPQSSAIGSSYNYTYAVSDTVPLGNYRAIFAASAFINSGNTAVPDQEALLYMLFAGAPLPVMNGPYAQQKIFLSYSGGASSTATICNGVPVDPAYGIRIDDSTGEDNNSPSGQSTPCELGLFRGHRPLLVPEGCALLCHNGTPTLASGTLGAIITLRLSYVQLKLSEDFDL